MKTTHTHTPLLTHPLKPQSSRMNGRRHHKQVATYVLGNGCTPKISPSSEQDAASRSTYSSSLPSTWGQSSRRLSSLYIRNRMRNMHARLCVSCFSRFGLALPLKPATKPDHISNGGATAETVMKSPPPHPPDLNKENTPPHRKLSWTFMFFSSVLNFFLTSFSSFNILRPPGWGGVGEGSLVLFFILQKNPNTLKVKKKAYLIWHYAMCQFLGKPLSWGDPVWLTGH